MEEREKRFDDLDPFTDSGYRSYVTPWEQNMFWDTDMGLGTAGDDPRVESPLQFLASSWRGAKAETVRKIEMLKQNLIGYCKGLIYRVDHGLRSFMLKPWKDGYGGSRAPDKHIRVVTKKYRHDECSFVLACTVLVLFTFSIIAGVTVYVQKSSSRKNVDAPHFSAKRVQLEDGRYVAYEEQGVCAERARYSILVVHGFLSSRLAGIPGIKSSLLEEFGVRLVAYDLPGFGESDPHPGRNYTTSANDMASIADALNLGERFWVLAHSGGGPHAWAAIRYIPERLSGVAMVSPAASPYDRSMSKHELNKTWSHWRLRRKLLYFIARHFPSILPSFLRRTLVKKIRRFTRSIYATVGKKDQALLEKEDFRRFLEADLLESIRQSNTTTLAEELILLVNNWGFGLRDLRLKVPEIKGVLKKLRFFLGKETVELEGFQQPVHIWQGTDDNIVSVAVGDYVKKILHHINLHKLDKEGHYSWFCFCDDCHRDLLQTLFGSPEGPKDLTKSPTLLSTTRDSLLEEANPMRTLVQVA